MTAGRGAVLAIDPGTTRSAWVSFVDGRIDRHGIPDNEDMVSMLRRITPSDPGAIVIEMVSSYGMRYVGAETYETCVWIGRFVEALHPLPVHRITRPEVKAHILGSPRGKDPDVLQALKDRLGPKGTKRDPGPTYGIKGDEWAALAVAVTWADTHGDGA